MDPPVAWSPLMQAYGHYFRAKFLDRALVPRRRKAEVYLALGLCKTTAEGLSRPLVGALDSHLREGILCQAQA
jgi:isocitrate dehydrogenase kinase/phosphatase